jgi:hypothetical protein
MARKARSGAVSGAFRKVRGVQRRSQHFATGYGTRTSGRRTRPIVRAARRTGRGARAFASGLHPRAANGRFRRK